MDQQLGLPRYDSYKDSGVGWIGDIPEGWEIKSLKAVLTERKENNDPIKTKDILSLCMYRGVIPYAEKGNSGNKAKADLTAYRLAYPGDIVLNSMNVIVGSVGLSKYFGAVSPVYYMLRPRKREDYVEYFDAVFQTVCFQKNLTRLGNGILIKKSEASGKLNTIRMRIPMSKLNRELIPYPCPREQQRIANFLDKKTAEIDEIIAKKQRLIELLKEQKAILINQAVTKGLNPNVAMRDSGVEWIGEVPAGWKGKKAKFLFVQSRLPVHKNDGVVTAYRDGQVTLRTNRRTEGYTIAILEQGYQGIRKGQLVLNSMDAFAGAIGVSDSDGKCSPEYVICDPIDHEEVVPMYYALLLREMALSGYIEVISSAVRQRAMRIRFNNLASLLLPVPPITEQTDIVKRVADLKIRFDAVIETLNREIETINEYRAILIANTVTGKIKI